MTFVMFLNKWLHLLSMIAGLGSVFLVRFVLIPSATPDFHESETGRAFRRRLGITTGILWLIILITGFVNLFLVSATVNKGYHMILGMKIMLALVMFVLAMALSHPLPLLSKLQKNRGPVLLAIALLGLVVVGMSAHLNISRITGTGLDAKALEARATQAGIQAAQSEAAP